MKKSSQIQSVDASAPAIPERVSVAMTETAPGELSTADLSGLDLVALMIDGVQFAESCCVVALGVDIGSNKHPLAPASGGLDRERHAGLRAAG